MTELDESGLTELLRALPRPEPSAAFAARLRQQFAMMQRRQRRQALATLLFGLTTSVLVVATLLVAVVANVSPLVQSAAELLAGLAVAGQAAVTVLASAPVLGVLLAAATSTAALACLYTLRRTALAYAEVK